MRFVSWNVNGLRAVLKKGFEDVFDAFDADVFCLQETKCQAGQVQLCLPKHSQYWSCPEEGLFGHGGVFQAAAAAGAARPGVRLP